MQTVPVDAVVSGEERFEGLPERLRDALGELRRRGQGGPASLSVGVGLGVLHELLESEVAEVCGPKGRHDADRVAYRHGRDDGAVTLGGRRVAVERPRMRTGDGGSDVPLASYEHFASRDALSAVVHERMLAGVSTRRYARTQEPGSVDEQVVDLAHVRRAHRRDRSPS